MEEHMWLQPGEGDSGLMTEVHMGDYMVSAWVVADSALTAASDNGTEMVTVSNRESMMLIGRETIDEMISSHPTPYHGVYAVGILVGQTLTMEAIRLAQSDDGDE